MRIAFCTRSKFLFVSLFVRLWVVALVLHRIWASLHGLFIQILVGDPCTLEAGRHADTHPSVLRQRLCASVAYVPLKKKLSPKKKKSLAWICGPCFYF
jgi:hypothetical protein